jgi:hypothetical protein
LDKFWDNVTSGQHKRTRLGFMYGMKRGEGCKGRVERAEGCKGWLKRAEGHNILGVGCSAPLFWSSWNTANNGEYPLNSAWNEGQTKKIWASKILRLLAQMKYWWPEYFWQYFGVKNYTEKKTLWANYLFYNENYKQLISTNI